MEWTIQNIKGDCMKEELKNKYVDEGKVNIALVCSYPPKENRDDCKEADLIKMLYIENTVDDSGFVTLQLQTYSMDDEVQSLIVYGKNVNGIPEVRIHEVGHRLYPHLTIVDGIHAGVKGLEKWQANGGLENFLEALTDYGLIVENEE